MHAEISELEALVGLDSRGVYRSTRSASAKGAWRFWRDAPGLSQRFTGTFSEDGDTITGLVERITGALVPDGVARVEIRLRHRRYLAAAVHDNYYEINTGDELAPAWGVRWLDARGHTIDHRRR